ncbi:hypothetical protein BZL30_7640 [Mycobacterium kansasii]|uniref:Uncharacterized protein n=1 Tax=Mycobacterium kansasii TaxID=1768 RepID=A0A1V3WLB6_MYCKA|nr:hypothetical protein BZL30_7640 [Mycobacterium kansasii]
MSTPSVATLVHRLAGCPDDFLAPPLIGDRGVVAVAAVLGDTLASLGAALPDDWLAVLTPGQTDAATENWLRACLVSCWLASDESARSLLSGPLFWGCWVRSCGQWPPWCAPNCWCAIPTGVRNSPVWCSAARGGARRRNR